MSKIFFRSLVVFMGGLFALGFVPFAYAKANAPKVQTYSGNGITFQYPVGWNANDTKPIREAFDLEVVKGGKVDIEGKKVETNGKFGMKQGRSLVALVHQKHLATDANGQPILRAYLLVITDKEIKKGGETLDAIGYAKVGLEGLPPKFAVDGGAVKKVKLKTAKLNGAQWGLIHPYFPDEEYRATTVRQGDAAYSIIVKTEKGKYKTDKDILDAYTKIVETFAFAKVKGKKK